MGKPIGSLFATLPRRTSLYASIVTGVIAVCVALLALDGWHTWQARATALADDKAETANLASSLAQHMHDELHSVDSILLDLRERVETDGVSPAALARLHSVMAARVAELPQVHGLFLYDANGDWLATSVPSVPAGLNNSDREYFRYHRLHTDPRPFVGRPVHSKSDGSWIITVSRRVDDGQGVFKGIVLATISIDYLDAFYAKFDVGQQGVISLMTTDGLLVARKNADAPPIGTDYSAGQIFQEFLPHSPSGSYRYVSVHEGIVRLGSYRRVDDYPLVILVSHGFDEALASWRADAETHLAITIVLAAALAVMGFRFAQQVKRQQAAQRIYRLLADNSSDAIICTDLAGKWVYVSPAFSALSGWSMAEALSRPWQEFVHPDDRAALAGTCRQLQVGGPSVSLNYRALCESGAYLWVEGLYHLISAADGQPAQYIGNIRDISARRAVEDALAEATRQLAIQASTDGLTGLSNRRRFDEALDQEWQRAIRDEQELSLLLIDIDRFKLYNDRYGHPQGDACLRTVAAAIAGCARRPADLPARYGGEEMVLLLPNTDERGAARVAETVRAAIEAASLPHEDNLPLRVITGSVGAATMLPHAALHESGAQPLVAAADAALYEAKRAGRNRVVLAGEAPSSPAPPVLPDEQRRLDVLDQYEAAGAADHSDSLDRIARLTAALFHAPLALVSLVGMDRQCFAGRTGIDAEGTPREISFCAHAIAGQDIFTVADATRDPRFSDNPLVTGEPHIRFYAGAPLLSPLGQTLGSLCIVDHVARPPLTSPERLLLADLASLAVSYMEQVRLQAEVRP